MPEPGSGPRVESTVHPHRSRGLLWLYFEVSTYYVYACRQFQVVTVSLGFERRPTDAPDWPGWQLRDGTEAPEGTCRCAGCAVAGSPFTLFGIDRTGTVDTD